MYQSHYKVQIKETFFLLLKSKPNTPSSIQNNP